MKFKSKSNLKHQRFVLWLKVPSVINPFKKRGRPGDRLKGFNSTLGVLILR
jgi:hypothetical protein